MAKTTTKLVEFIREIFNQFGMPRKTITDCKTQFIAQEFLDCWDNKGITMNFTLVVHPQSNGQVERANGLILRGLKPCVFIIQNHMMEDGCKSYLQFYFTQINQQTNSILISIWIRIYASLGDGTLIFLSPKIHRDLFNG